MMSKVFGSCLLFGLRITWQQSMLEVMSCEDGDDTASCDEEAARIAWNCFLEVADEELASTALSCHLLPGDARCMVV